MNTNTQEPDCFMDEDGKLWMRKHTHSPDGPIPHPDKDHPGIWNDLLQDRNYTHRHPYSNCSADNGVAPLDVDVGDLNATVEMPACEWRLGSMGGGVYRCLIREKSGAENSVYSAVDAVFSSIARTYVPLSAILFLNTVRSLIRFDSFASAIILSIGVWYFSMISWRPRARANSSNSY